MFYYTLIVLEKQHQLYCWH